MFAHGCRAHAHTSISVCTDDIRGCESVHAAGVEMFATTNVSVLYVSEVVEMYVCVNTYAHACI